MLIATLALIFCCRIQPQRLLFSNLSLAHDERPQSRRATFSHLCWPNDRDIRLRDRMQATCWPACNVALLPAAPSGRTTATSRTIRLSSRTSILLCVYNPHASPLDSSRDLRLVCAAHIRLAVSALSVCTSGADHRGRHKCWHSHLYVVAQRCVDCGVAGCGAGD